MKAEYLSNLLKRINALRDATELKRRSLVDAQRDFDCGMVNISHEDLEDLITEAWDAGYKDCTVTSMHYVKQNSR